MWPPEVCFPVHVIAETELQYHCIPVWLLQELLEWQVCQLRNLPAYAMPHPRWESTECKYILNTHVWQGCPSLLQLGVWQVFCWRANTTQCFAKACQWFPLKLLTWCLPDICRSTNLCCRQNRPEKCPCSLYGHIALQSRIKCTCRGF